MESIMKHTLGTVVAVGLACSASAAPITVSNADFEAGPDNNNATDWNDSAVASVYYLAGEGAYVGNRAMSIQDGFSSEQVLAGVTAGGYTSFTIDFESGFRDDFFTGSADIEVALIAGGNVIASDTISVTGTGSPNTAAIPFTATQVVLGSLDLTGLTGSEAVSLRFSNTTGGGGSPWERTALVDNVSIDATPVPEPGSLALLSLGGLAMLRRRR